MRATSAIQFEAASRGGCPPVEEVRDGVWMIAVPMPPGQPGLDYSFVTVLRDENGRLHLVDAGWDTPDNRVLLTGALRTIGGELASITITHGHPDHLGLAPWLREERGARLVMHERELRSLAHVPRADEEVLDRWQVPADRRAELLAVRVGEPAPLPVIDTLVTGTDIPLDIPGRTVRGLLTPGHTDGHLALALPEEQLLITGDLLLPTVYSGLGLGGPGADNPVAAHAASLATLTAYDGYEALPGHGYRFRGIAARAAITRAHHGSRTEEVRAILEANPNASVWNTARAVTWTRGWAALRGMFLLSALAQIEQHAELVRSAAAARAV